MPLPMRREYHGNGGDLKALRPQWFTRWSKGLLAAQAVQHGRRGESVRRQAGTGLELHQRRARARAQPPIRLAADVEAAPRQVLLQLEPLAEREHPLVARPGLHERRFAAEAVGEMADGERIGLGRI